MAAKKRISEVIKRPKKFISHKRQHLAARVHVEEDLTITPTLKQLKKDKAKHVTASAYTSSSRKANKSRKSNPIKVMNIKRVKKTQKGMNKGPKSSLKELNPSKRKKWVPLNKKQINFLSNALEVAIGVTLSRTDNQSAETFEEWCSFLNATRSILMQSASKVKVPPTEKSMANPLSEAMYTAISKNLDATIHSLNEAVEKERNLLKQKVYLLNK